MWGDLNHVVPNFFFFSSMTQARSVVLNAKRVFFYCAGRKLWWQVCFVSFVHHTNIAWLAEFAYAKVGLPLFDLTVWLTARYLVESCFYLFIYFSPPLAYVGGHIPNCWTRWCEDLFISFHIIHQTQDFHLCYLSYFFLAHRVVEWQHYIKLEASS